MKLLESLHHFDARMLLWFTHSRYQKQLAQLAKTVSKTGDGYLQVILPLACWWFDDREGEQFLRTVLLAFAIQLPTYWLLKNVLKRRRPPQAIPSFHSAIMASDQFSFPSGHSAAAFLLANLTALFYGMIALPLYLWASSVAMSRIILGVHFPGDILAGISLGTVVAFYVLPFALAG